MPESLHADLARASEQAGVSLNGYINEALANAVGRRPTTTARPAPAGQAARRNRPFAQRLLLVNLVVVAAVGALVIVLLVQALR